MMGMILGITLQLAACGEEPIPARITPLPVAPLPEQPAGTLELDFVFLGTGGMFLRSGGNALLGDPFFSNPPIADWLLLRPLTVRTGVIDRYLPPTDQLRGILVAHAHHDHAMDLPYIASVTPPAVKIYGSDTLRNSLISQVPPERLVALNNLAADQQNKGQWVYLSDGSRVLPIRSGHAPHLLGKVFNSDRVSEPLPQVPQTVLEWQSGQPFSFVIDFLEAGIPRFRVYYQSSAADAPDGMPPTWLLEDGKDFDLALLGIANHGRLQDFPVSILSTLRPHNVVLLHWDVFWDEYSQTETHPVPGLQLTALASKLDSVLAAQTPVYLPQRGAYLRLQVSP